MYYLVLLQLSVLLWSLPIIQVCPSVSYQEKCYRPSSPYRIISLCAALLFFFCWTELNYLKKLVTTLIWSDTVSVFELISGYAGEKTSNCSPLSVCAESLAPLPSVWWHVVQLALHLHEKLHQHQLPLISKAAYSLCSWSFSSSSFSYSPLFDENSEKSFHFFFREEMEGGGKCWKWWERRQVAILADEGRVCG